MSNYALVKDGVVDNVAVVDEDTDGGRDYLEAIAEDYDQVIKTDDAYIGQQVTETGELVPLPEPEPEPEPGAE